MSTITSPVVRMRKNALPAGWEELHDPVINRTFYIDHNSQTTTWVDPRERSTKPATFSQCVVGELPFGWEVAHDPMIGKYYINHNDWTTHLPEDMTVYFAQQKAAFSQMITQEQANLAVRQESHRRHSGLLVNEEQELLRLNSLGQASSISEMRMRRASISEVQRRIQALREALLESDVEVKKSQNRVDILQDEYTRLITESKPFYDHADFAQQRIREVEIMDRLNEKQRLAREQATLEHENALMALKRQDASREVMDAAKLTHQLAYSALRREQLDEQEILQKSIINERTIAENNRLRKAELLAKEEKEARRRSGHFLPASPSARHRASLLATDVVVEDTVTATVSSGIPKAQPTIRVTSASQASGLAVSSAQDRTATAPTLKTDHSEFVVMGGIREVDLSVQSQQSQKAPKQSDARVLQLGMLRSDSMSSDNSKRDHPVDLDTETLRRQNEELQDECYSLRQQLSRSNTATQELLKSVRANNDTPRSMVPVDPLNQSGISETIDRLHQLESEFEAIRAKLVMQPQPEAQVVVKVVEIEKAVAVENPEMSLALIALQQELEQQRLRVHTLERTVEMERERSRREAEALLREKEAVDRARILNEQSLAELTAMYPDEPGAGIMQWAQQTLLADLDEIAESHKRLQDELDSNRNFQPSMSSFDLTHSIPPPPLPPAPITEEPMQSFVEQESQPLEPPPTLALRASDSPEAVNVHSPPESTSDPASAPAEVESKVAPVVAPMTPIAALPDIADVDVTPLSALPGFDQSTPMSVIRAQQLGIKSPNGGHASFAGVTPTRLASVSSDAQKRTQSFTNILPGAVPGVVERRTREQLRHVPQKAAPVLATAASLPSITHQLHHVPAPDAPAPVPQRSSMDFLSVVNEAKVQAILSHKGQAPQTVMARTLNKRAVRDQDQVLNPERLTMREKLLRFSALVAAKNSGKVL